MSEAKFDKREVPRTAWDRAPWNRWSFQHVSEVLPTVSIGRGTAPVRPLARNTTDLEGLEVPGVGGGPVTLERFLDETFTDGFLVLHHGAIACERYLNRMTADTLHLSQSAAKSFVGMLAGIVIARGVIARGTRVADILPELERTAYRGATIGHLLDMTSGVRFAEDYTDPRSHMGQLDVASGWKPVPDGEDPANWPANVFELILALEEREAEDGERFAYRSIETDVLAFVLERATGKRLPQLISEEIWQKLGMERDANMTIDSAGYALADGGLSACLRDYARFGQTILEGGRGVIPADWIEATRSGDHTMFGAPYSAVLPEGAYRNQFWIEDPRNRSIMARGVFGQLVYVSWEFEMVVVKLSSWPDFVNPAWTRATLAAVHRIGEALNRARRALAAAGP